MEGRTVKRLILIVLMIVSLCGVSYAAEEFAKVGTVGGQFLKLGVGARAAGMGASFVSVADDASSVFWNPAGVARVTRNVIAVNHAN